MGIPHLNRFLKEECKETINFISLAELSGKKIAVDISIYIYKYVSDNNLIENMYLMLSVFREYNIIPVFIFDGKPPAEKKELLCKRIQDKKIAQEEYNKLFEQLKEKTIDDSEKQELINSMDMLKKQFISISKNQIEDVKNLIRAYGATYYDAPGEADELCAKLVLNGKVWACLSEDMDMFVYGVHRVIRYLSLLNHTAVLYDMEGILKRLGISQKELREICILSGTDYNIHKNNNNPTLHKTLKYFKKYKKENKIDSVDFYDWLKTKTDYIDDYLLLKKIYSMFDLQNFADVHDNLKAFHNISIENGPIMKQNIREILKTDGFIFPIS